MKSKLDLQFPPWEHVEFKDQIELYFKIVRQFNNCGLNPKTDFPCNIMTESNIKEVFGPYSSLKVTYPYLHAETKQEFLRLY